MSESNFISSALRPNPQLISHDDPEAGRWLLDIYQHDCQYMLGPDAEGGTVAGRVAMPGRGNPAGPVYPAAVAAKWLMPRFPTDTAIVLGPRSVMQIMRRLACHYPGLPHSGLTHLLISHIESADCIVQAWAPSHPSPAAASAVAALLDQMQPQAPSYASAPLALHAASFSCDDWEATFMHLQRLRVNLRFAVPLIASIEQAPCVHAKTKTQLRDMVRVMLKAQLTTLETLERLLRDAGSAHEIASQLDHLRIRALDLLCEFFITTAYANGLREHITDGLDALVTFGPCGQWVTDVQLV